MSAEKTMAKKSEEKYRLTPMGCLYAVLLDYVGPDHLLDIRKIQGRVGEHIVEDFMDALVKTGYLERVNDEESV